MTKKPKKPNKPAEWMPKRHTRRQKGVDRRDDLEGNHTRVDAMGKVPTELVDMIFHDSAFRDIVRCAAVSRARYRAISDRDRLWKTIALRTGNSKVLLPALMPFLSCAHGRVSTLTMLFVSGAMEDYASIIDMYYHEIVR